MMVASVDHRDPHGRAGKMMDHLQPAEARANDDDMMLTRRWAVPLTPVTPTDGIRARVPERRLGDQARSK
jgi:hypothetical protein